LLLHTFFAFKGTVDAALLVADLVNRKKEELVLERLHGEFSAPFTMETSMWRATTDLFPFLAELFSNCRRTDFRGRNNSCLNHAAFSCATELELLGCFMMRRTN
jgi:hypothetical protein